MSNGVKGLLRAQVERPVPNGVASGETTRTSTVLWARAEQAGTILFELSTDPTFPAASTLTATGSSAGNVPNVDRMSRSRWPSPG